MRTTWLSRDLPVLDAILRWNEEGRLAGVVLDVNGLAVVTGLDKWKVALAVMRLNGAHIRLSTTTNDIGGWFVSEVYPAA